MIFITDLHRVGGNKKRLDVDRHADHDVRQRAQAVAERRFYIRVNDTDRQVSADRPHLYAGCKYLAANVGVGKFFQLRLLYTVPKFEAACNLFPAARKARIAPLKFVRVERRAPPLGRFVQFVY